MAYQAKVEVVFERWGEVGSALVQEAAALRHETGARILEKATGNAPKVTESLARSGYLVDADGTSTYAQAVEAAREKNADVEILPEVEAEPNTTIVAFAAAHAAANEFYTGEKNPGAHPFLTPAAESERSAFDAAVAALGGRVR